MKVQIFSGGNLPELQATINEWLAERPNISVTEFLQSESFGQGFGVTITIIYLEFDR